MLYLIDLFCGAGGVTTGASMAENVTVIACVNHDPLAIKSHAANHPDCMHFTEDIRTLDLTDIANEVSIIRTRDENAIIGLWASLECTNFSKAKGGLPRDADSRTLAEHLFRYLKALRPDIVYIENVEEFMSWGPLDENGKPISRKNGCDYQRWVKNMCDYNYNFDFRILNAADFGAYTSRKRYFAQFVHPDFEISWPKPTHAKKPFSDAFGSLKKWKPVKEILSLEKHGESIFGRKKNLSDKTYERIYHGLIKFVAGGKDAFMLKYNSINGKTGVHHPPSVDEPCPTVSTQGRLGLVNAQFISKYFSGKPEHKSCSIDGPAATVKTIDNQALVSADFMTTYHGNGSNVHSLQSPSPTIPTKDSVALVQPFIMRDFSGGGQSASIEAPAGSVMPSPKMNLVSPQYFIMNPQWFNNNGGSIEQPCFTLIARMDKTPPYLIATESGALAIAIEENDTPHMKLIKQFMAIYGIIDIKMRMLFVEELLKIQGFPADYKLEGTQADKKKFIGNAVEVNQARVILQASVEANFIKTKTI